jgi:hypothetical protein
VLIKFEKLVKEFDPGMVLHCRAYITTEKCRACDSKTRKSLVQCAMTAEIWPLETVLAVNRSNSVEFTLSKIQGVGVTPICDGFRKIYECGNCNLENKLFYWMKDIRAKIIGLLLFELKPMKTI